MDTTRQAIRTILTEQAATQAPPGDIYIHDVQPTAWVVRVVISAGYAAEREGDWESPQELAKEIAATLERSGRGRDYQVEGPDPGSVSGGDVPEGGFFIDVSIQAPTQREARERVGRVLQDYGDLYAG